jgi:hypothetical protein
MSPALGRARRKGKEALKRQSPSSSVLHKLAGVAGSDNFAVSAMQRTAEFVDPGVRWQRSLWNTGLVLCLKELIEASDAAQSGALSSQSVKWLAEWARGMIADDPGAGSKAERRAIADLLSQDLSSGGARYLELRQWIEAIESSYLLRWSAAVTDEARPSREQTARALAAHLLDLGLSPQALTSWLKNLEADDAADIFDGAKELADTSDQTFEVMLLFEQPPAERIAKPPEWRNAQAVSKWLNANRFGSKRQHGGLLLTLRARDMFAAASQAADVADRVLARSSVGTKGDIRIGPRAYVGGHKPSISLRRSRRVDVRALEREQRLLHLDRTGPVDDALELLSHLKHAPAPVAVTSGWAAIESLLSGPGDSDKIITAERLGSIVACSWPRAELTTLSWASHERSPSDGLGQPLRECSTNRERAQIFLDRLAGTDDPLLSKLPDRLAQKRTEKLMRDPRAGLLAIQRQAAASFRRLYRQRNLVVHGGQISGEALAATLRTVAPIAGAGLDRITHAYLTSERPPLDVAAKARSGIERAGSVGAPSLTALLE